MVDVVARNAVQELIRYCQEVMGQNLRAVTRYSSTQHDRVYTRGDLLDQLGIEDEMREMFRVPLMQMHKSAWQFSRVHPTIADPVSTVFNFGTIVVVQVPISASEGIIVTLDWSGDLPSGFVSTCQSIVATVD